MCREVDLYISPLMASLGDSKEDPIFFDSPLSSARVPVSPIKVLSSPESAQKCRAMVTDLSGRSTLVSRKLAFDDENENEGCSGESANGCPIYEYPPVGSYTGENILQILLNTHTDDKKVCTKRPSGITQSSTFVVDLDGLHHPDDVKKDEFGKWNYSGSHVVTYEAWKMPGTEKLRFERAPCSTSSKNSFQLRRVHCTHPSDSTCQRLLAFVTEPDGNPHRLCLLSYKIPPGGVCVAAHGNSKSSKAPFYPTLPSTMELVKANARAGGPKQVLGVVSKSVGGVVAATSACDLPRNERQIAYIQRSTKSRSLSSSSLVGDPLADQVFALMQKAKLGDSDGFFVRDICPCPEPAFVLARDRQLDDMVRFCTVSTSFSILTVDPTFNLGNFDVTPVTYRHLMLESVRYGSCPLFIGPTLVHYKKTFHTYIFFASTLIGLRKGLQRVRAFGTDGEAALVDAFSHEFHYAIRLTCFIHFRRNIKKRLHDQGFPESEARVVLDDIFGCQQGHVFSEGLVDCKSEEEFSSKLSSLELRWDNIEGANPSIQPGFFTWFCTYKVETMKSTMLQPVREEAGLGCPPQTFTTNASETVNSILKCHFQHKSCQLLEFVSKLKDVVDEQEKEVERAVIGRGKYRFKEQYQHLVISEERWFRMTEQQRRKHLQKVASTAVDSTGGLCSVPIGGNSPCASTSTFPQIRSSGPSHSSSAPPHSSSGPSQNTNSASTELGLTSASVATDLNVPIPCLDGIWQKALELINTPGSIGPAPGFPDEGRLVLSRSGQRPHFVTRCKKDGKFKCDSDCANFKSLGICLHTVAVAQVHNQLSSFVAALKKATKKPNLTSLATHGMPTGRGKKGSQPPRKRKRNISPTVRTDRIQTTQSLQGDSSSFQSLGCGSTVNISLDHPSMGYPPPLSSSTPWTPSAYHYGPPDWFSGYPSMYSSPTPTSSSQQHPPMAENNSPFILCLIAGNISKCAGCGNKYTKPVSPPHDLCIHHREWRTFTPSGGIPQSKFSNAYYHVNLPCIHHKWPLFTPRELIITPEVYEKLGQQHYDLLATFGYYI